MGKVKKIKFSKKETKRANIALADQIEQDKTVKAKDRHKIRHRTNEQEEVCPCLILLY